MFQHLVKDNLYKVLGFCIFYGDKTFFKGTTIQCWNKAPKENVQLVLLYHNVNDSIDNPLRTSICGWDYYSFDGAAYQASNDTRLLSGDIKYGRWVETDYWHHIVQQALDSDEHRCLPRVAI